MENNWYIYRHLKPCGEVFYIGIGQTDGFKRAKSRHNRNRHWKNTVNKYGFETEILKSKLSKNEAAELEILLVAWYGRNDLGEGNLVNLTNGGEGVSGLKQTQESRDKRSEKIKILYKGEGNPFFGKNHTKDTKQFISDIQKQYFTYSEGSNKNVKQLPPRKKSRATIHIESKLILNSLRESSEYYGVPRGTMKSRMLGDNMFKGNLWYLDIYENMSESVPPIISFLEKSFVLKENIIK